MSEVRRWAHTVEWEGLQISATYMAINDRGKYVMHDDYATLEAELAKLHAGQEPVAYQCREIGEGDWADCDKKWFDYCERSPLHDTRKLYTTPQPSAVPDGWRELLQEAAEYAPPYGTIVAMTSQMALGSKARRMLSAAPSAPATASGVNQQLLEALEALAISAPSACCGDFNHKKGDFHEDNEKCPPLDRYEKACLLARAAIAAARKEGGKV